MGTQSAVWVHRAKFGQTECSVKATVEGPRGMMGKLYPKESQEDAHIVLVW